MDDGLPPEEPDYFTQQWGWWVTLHQLTKLRNQQWTDILEMGAVEFLNSMAYLKDDTERKRKEIEEMKKKMKQKRL